MAGTERRRLCLAARLPCMLGIVLIGFAGSLLQAHAQSKASSRTGSATSIPMLSRSVVKLVVRRSDGSGSTGTGVVIDPNGIIATAAHVVVGATDVQAQFPTGESLGIEGFLLADTLLDLAFLRVAGFQLPTAKLGNSDSVVLGERLIAITAPLGLETTVSDGLLSSTRLFRGYKLLQVSVPVSPGSSGGPLFSEDGEVVGLVVSGITKEGAQNLNFALPINYVQGKLAIVRSHSPQPLADLPHSRARNESDTTDSAIAAIRGSRDERLPARVNDSLGLDWTALNGVEVDAEVKQENFVRTRVHGVYQLSRSVGGKPVLMRDVVSHTWRHLSLGLEKTHLSDFKDHTSVEIDGSKWLIESSARLAPLHNSVVGSSSTASIAQGIAKFSLDTIQQSAAVPEGSITRNLIQAAIAALPDSLPASLHIYYAKHDRQLNQVRLVPVRVDIGRRGKLKVPFSAAGRCGNGVKTVTREQDVVWIALRDGTDVEQFPVLSKRPHVRVDVETTKCVSHP